MSETQLRFLANLIDTSTVTIRVQSRLDEYVYLEPQIIISKSDTELLKDAIPVIRGLTLRSPLFSKKKISRLVVSGWKSCSKVLSNVLPFLNNKRSHANYILQLNDLRVKTSYLLSSPTALDIISELQELNRRTTRRTLLDVVIANAYEELSKNQPLNT